MGFLECIINCKKKKKKKKKDFCMCDFSFKFTKYILHRMDVYSITIIKTFINLHPI